MKACPSLSSWITTRAHHQPQVQGAPRFLFSLLVLGYQFMPILHSVCADTFTDSFHGKLRGELSSIRWCAKLCARKVGLMGVMVEPRSQTSSPKQEATRGKAAQAHVKALGQVCRGSGWGDGGVCGSCNVETVAW